MYDVTWLAEYYPIDAEYVPVEDAALHSLNKWIGLRSSNCVKHDVYISRGDLCHDGEDVLYIDSDSCALCYHHIGTRFVSKCKSCPIKKLTGLSCDVVHGPWEAYVVDNNVEPMISVLEDVVLAQYMGEL